MRVTNKMLSGSFLRDMRSNLSNLQKLQQQMTSGKEIRKPSDDPFKVARAMQLHSDINANKQYNENIKDTINWLDTTDTALNQAGNVLQRVHELLISSGNAAYGDSERRAIKDEINEKIGELSQVLNTNFDGKYIFGGSRGTTKPVDVAGGTEYKDAKVIKIADLEQWKTKTIKFTDGITKDVDLNPVSSNIKNINDLAKEINTQLNGTNVKAIPVISDNSIMIINENAGNVKIGSTGINDIDNLTDKDIPKTDIKSSGNTKLHYYKKGGGEIDTNADSTTDDAKQHKMVGQKLKVEISQGVTMDYNVAATDLLEFKNEKGESLDMREIFEAVTNHLDGKDSKGTALDSASVEKLINNDLKKVKDALNNLLKIRSAVGAKQNRMESAKEKNEEENFNMKEILSKTEDIDITEKTMQYATMQTVYMASLQTSAKVLQPSLIDYLR